MTYADKLLSPKWQRKRLEIFARDNWQCTVCFSENRTLHIHHKLYTKDADPWEYEAHHLTTLCFICHKKEHEQIIDPIRKYEHLIIYEELPAVINSLNIQLSELGGKLKENISDELSDEIQANIIYIQKQKMELLNLLI